MIYLMRHGQDDEMFVGGWSDVSLLPIGVKECENTAKWLKDNLEIKQIISSDVLRARQTAFIVANYLGVPVFFTKDLREQNKGLLNGMPISTVLDLYPEYMEDVDVNTVYPDGESLTILYERMKIYLNEILSMDDNTLLITHRGVINMIYYILNDIKLDMDKKRFNVTTASVHELDKENKLIRKVR